MMSLESMVEMAPVTSFFVALIPYDNGFVEHGRILTGMEC